MHKCKGGRWGQVPVMAARALPIARRTANDGGNALIHDTHHDLHVQEAKYGKDK